MSTTVSSGTMLTQISIIMQSKLLVMSILKHRSTRRLHLLNRICVNMLHPLKHLVLFLDVMRTMILCRPVCQALFLQQEHVQRPPIPYNNLKLWILINSITLQTPSTSLMAFPPGLLNTAQILPLRCTYTALAPSLCTHYIS